MTKETNIPPFGEEGLGSFKNFKFPGVDMETLLASYQRNMELMNTTQRIGAETVQSVMELQNQYLKRVFDQWNEQIKYGFSKSPLEEKTTRQAENAKATVDKTIEHVRDVNSIVAKSNEKIIQSVQKRFKEGLDESLNLAKKGKTQR